MSKTTVPEAKDWNNYWSLDQTERFTKVSWSKRRIMGVLNKYIREGGIALDAGCGSGFFSKYFCDRGMKTVSLDYSEEALAIARRLTENKTRTFKVDLRASSVPKEVNEKFDIIFTDGLFEHFPSNEQDQIMFNFKTLLKDDGFIITFVPNRWSPWELIRPFYMPGIDEKPFTMKALVELNQRNDLEILERHGINTLPWRISPDKFLGQQFGMLLFTIARLK